MNHEAVPVPRTWNNPRQTKASRYFLHKKAITDQNKTLVRAKERSQLHRGNSLTSQVPEEQAKFSFQDTVALLKSPSVFPSL